MNDPQVYSPGAANVLFTDAAAHKVRSLLDEEDNKNLKLRVFVTGGGCSGFQYGFTFDENEEEGDTRVDKGGVTLLVDPMSVRAVPELGTLHVFLVVDLGPEQVLHAHRRDIAGRPDERAVPARGRDRLQGRRAGCPVRDPQP